MSAPPHNPEIDATLIEVDGAIWRAVAGDGEAQDPSTPMVFSRRDLRRRRLVWLLLNHPDTPREDLIGQVAAEHQVTRETVLLDMQALTRTYRAIADDEALADVLAVEMRTAAMVRHGAFHEKAIDELNSLQTRATAAKNARAEAATVLGLLERRSRRWEARSRIDVAQVSGGTVEQRAAVSLLLNIVDTTATEVPDPSAGESP